MSHNQMHRLQSGKGHRRTVDANAAAAALFTKSAETSAAQKPRARASAFAELRAFASAGVLKAPDNKQSRSSGGSKLFLATAMPGIFLLPRILGSCGFFQTHVEDEPKKISYKDVPNVCSENKDNLVITIACKAWEKEKPEAVAREEKYPKVIAACRAADPSSPQIRNDCYYATRNAGGEDREFLRLMEKRAQWEKNYVNSTKNRIRDIGVDAWGLSLLAGVLGAAIGAGVGVHVNNTSRAEYQSEEGIRKEAEEETKRAKWEVDWDAADIINAEYRRQWDESPCR